MLVTTFVHCLCNNSATCVSSNKLFTCNCAPNYSGLYFSMTLTTAPHCLIRIMQHVSAPVTPTLVNVHNVRIVTHEISPLLAELVKMNLKEVLCV